MNRIPQDIQSVLKEHDQLHVLKWWDQLTVEQQQTLIGQLRQVDFSTIRSAWQQARHSEPAAGLTSRAQRAQRPQNVVYRSATSTDQTSRHSDIEAGLQLLSSGRVAVVTVAGGQGTRLGFDAPKGVFPIGPITNRSLFQIFAEQLVARQRRHQTVIPWLIMTSPATHAATESFLRDARYFGLDPQHVHLFQQGSLPAMDAATGRLLLADRASLCLAPDGHGGMLAALKDSGLLQMLQDTHIEHIYYHQVDNPTATLCDPSFLGAHVRHASEMTTCVVQKRAPSEKMGVLVEVDGTVQIIEYSELNETEAAATDDNGEWIFWAGNTAIHAFSVSFLQCLTETADALPLHVAHKKVEHIDEDGQPVNPDQPNALKLERFIFDALPLAENPLIVEADRECEFNPVKNAQGADSPGTARAAISRIGRSWLQAAGIRVDENAVVEISPLIALEAEELADALRSGRIAVENLVSSDQTLTRS